MSKYCKALDKIMHFKLYSYIHKSVKEKEYSANGTKCRKFSFKLFHVLTITTKMQYTLFTIYKMNQIFLLIHLPKQ
jgi:hypothetical protein